MGTCASTPEERPPVVSGAHRPSGIRRESTVLQDAVSRGKLEKPKSKASRKFFYLSQTALGIYFTDNELNDFANIWELVKYNPNTLLYKQGEKSSSLYIVGAGELKMFSDLRKPEDRPTDEFKDEEFAPEMLAREYRFICTKGIGDVFGQEALIAMDENAPRVAYMKVVHKAELMVITIDQIKDHLMGKRDLSYEKKLYAGLGFNLNTILPHTTMFKDAAVDFTKNPILWSMFRWRNLAANEILFEEGSIGKALYVVYEGHLMIQLAGREENRSKTVVAEIKQGDTLGEIAMLIDAPRSGTVVAKTPSALLELSIEEFNCLLDHFPEIARRITEIARKHVVYNFRKYRIPFFESLNEEQYNLLGELCSVQQIPPGEIIFDYGDYGDRFYMIAHGDVGIFVPKDEKKQMEKANDGDGVQIKLDIEVAGQLEVCRIGPGRYFGELALVTDSPRGATARAHTKCVILSITKTKFQQFFEKHPEAGADFQIKLAKYQIKIEQLLAHPRGVEYFLRHCKSEYSEENVRFYLAVKDFEQKAAKLSAEDLTKEAAKIINEYVRDTSPWQVNLAGDLNKQLIDVLESNSVTANSFAGAKKEIHDLMNRDSFPRFKSSPLFQEFLKEMEAYDYVQTEKHLDANHGTRARNSFMLPKTPDGQTILPKLPEARP